MKIQHEGKQYEVEQDRKCADCGKEFYILIFDLRVEASNDQAGFSTCPHCQNEQIVPLTDI